MTFTKRETQRAEHVAWAMKVVLGIILVGVFAFACGCSSQATTVEGRTEELAGRVAAMEAAGLKGRAVLIWGGGHVAGQAFNFSGSSGFVEIRFGSDDDE